MTVQAWIPGEHLAYPVDVVTLMLAEAGAPPPPDDPAAEDAAEADGDAAFRDALAQAIGDARARRWQATHGPAIAAHAEWIARHGPPLARQQVG